MATRYKLSKEQLERVVENFVMEAASAKAPVKNHIPSQGSEAKKHVKNKISGKIVDKSEGMPSVTPMKKKLSHAPESKKFVSNSKMTHSNKAKVVKESDLFKGTLNEDIDAGLDAICTSLGIAAGTVSVGGDSVSKCFLALITIATGGGIGFGILNNYASDALKVVKGFLAKNKNKDNTDGMSDFMDDDLSVDKIKKELQLAIESNPKLKNQVVLIKKNK